MINPHQVLDYENWWNKSLNNIKPYRIPPLSNDIVTKLHNQLDASSDRIWRTRSAEEATKIIELLRELINSHTEEHTYKFSWNLSLYKNPPKKPNKVYRRNTAVLLHLFQTIASTNHIFLFSNKQTREYTPEEVAMIERASQDNAIKRALKLEATKVSTALHQMIPTNLVIVRCLRTGYLFVKQI